MNETSAERLEDVIQRLRRLEGQVQGVQRMVREGRSCLDVLTQLGAVRGALHEVEFGPFGEQGRASAVDRGDRRGTRPDRPLREAEPLNLPRMMLLLGPVFAFMGSGEARR